MDWIANNMDIIYYLIFGAVAGAIAGFIMRGRGAGLLGNIIVGVAGAFVGSWIFDKLNITIASGIVGSLIEAVAGASVLLLLLGFLWRR